MARDFNERQIMHGHGGYLWFNGKPVVTLQSVEMKINGDYEEINVCGDTATYRIYNGYSGEGSFSFLKMDSDIMSYIANGFLTGDIPETTILTKQNVPNTNKQERIAVHDVTFDEATLAKFEKKAMTETEVPFKFGRFEILETI